MRTPTIIIGKYALVLWCVALLNSCQVYHNTTARFNSYFLAKEKMLEVEQTLFGTMQNDYNNVLQVLAPIDTSAGQGQKAQLEYCIKMASRPIKFHPTSKWVDDCYLLIGKARLYLGDFTNASNTFKYVNTQSPDPDARHQAMTWLMRLYIETKDFRNVERIGELMSQEESPISDATARDFYVTMAHYHRIKNEYEKTAAYLEKALPLIQNREFYRRALFIVAQIYQKLGKNDQAYDYYQQLLRRNPDYDMMFQAQLNASRAFDVAGSNPEAVRKSEKYLKSLLSEDKNREFKDKIYFELGNFELKRDQTDEAIKYFEESVINSRPGSAQRAYSLLALGKVYYENKSDFEKAGDYYRQALQALDKNSEEYKQVEERNGALTRFMQEYQTVKSADRLLMLTAMSEQERDKFFDEEIKKEKQAIDKAQEENKKRGEANASQPNNNFDFGNPTQAKWYFYDERAIEQGKLFFVRTWGNRPLEDHWRRSRKQLIGNNTNNGNNSSDTGNGGGKDAQPSEEDLKYAAVASKEVRAAEIPKTPQEKSALEKDLQAALFKMGKIYYQELEETDNAQKSLQRFVKEFPQSRDLPEALFLLQKLCQESKKCDPIPYQQQLEQQFPRSLYTRMLQNKDFAGESNANNSEVEKKYEQAYQLLQQGNYKEADSTLDELLKAYPVNNHLDKIYFLKAMLLAKTSSDKALVERTIKDFLENYSRSSLVPMAEALLKAVQTPAGQ